MTVSRTFPAQEGGLQLQSNCHRQNGAAMYVEDEKALKLGRNKMGVSTGTQTLTLSASPSILIQMQRHLF